MKKTFISVCLAMLSMQGMAAPKPVIMYGKPNQILTSISANGKWACGVKSDGSSALIAFLWDLTSNEITSLGVNTQVYGVSNDGVAVGLFPCDGASSNGATMTVPGYWQDGEWHRLDISSVNSDGSGGEAYCISPDGQYIGGAIYIDNVFSPVLWKNGELVHVLNNGLAGLVQSMTNDGSLFGGWGYTSESRSTRQPVLWDANGQTTVLNGTTINPYQAVYDFTSDGKYALFIGDVNDGENKSLVGLHDLTTGKDIPLPYCTDDHRDVVMYGLSDSLSAVGFETEMSMSTFPIIYKNGKTMKLESYLIERGVDFGADSIIGKRTSDTDGIYNLVTCNDISKDDSTFAIQAGNKDQYEIPVIVKLNVNATNPEPVGVKASILNGLNVAKLVWKAPLLGADNILGYDVYRNGEKLNAEPVKSTVYYDYSVTPGTTYSYEVVSLFDGDVVSAKSVAASLSVPADEVNAPRAPYARMKGVDNVLVSWMKPLSNKPTLRYYDDTDEFSGFGGGSRSFECAVRYDSTDLRAYSDYKITSVSFCPRKEIESWTINIYSGEKLVLSQPINQELHYGHINTVKLENPISVPTDGDLYIAIQANVALTETSYDILGMVFDKATFGYSDLIRMVGEESFFYSLEEDAEQTGSSYPVSFIIGTELSKADGSQVNIDDISGYKVYRDGVLLGTTDATSYTDSDVAEGEHTYSVEAEYADGSVSDKSAVAFNAVANNAAYKSIKDITFSTGDTESQVVLSWNAPIDDDETNIQYSSEQANNGPVGTEDNGYGYTARTTYMPSKLRSYGGYNVNEVRFYPLADAEFTVIVMKDGQVIDEQYVDNYTVNQWNTVKLENPFVIDENSTYDLIIDCFDVTAEQAALAIDGLTAFSGLGDIVSTDQGESYTTISGLMGYDVPGNWLMGFVATAADSEPFPVDGYNVRIDAKTVTSEPVTTTSCTYDFGPGASTTAVHRANVDVVYSVKGTVSGSNVFFTLKDAIASGIDNNVINDIKITQEGNSYVRVEGDGVESIDVYSLGGALVDSTTGNVVNVSGVQSGMYILKVKTTTGTKTYKVRVTR